MNHTAVISSPIGPIGIQLSTDQQFVTHLNFLERYHELKPSSHPLVNHINTELENYFKNPHHVFSIPMQLIGTEFQKCIWQALCKIPVGKTQSYGELAEKLDTSPRVIGNACRANPLPLIIPCHRIVAKQHIGGFAGATRGDLLNIKTWLLGHETHLN
jgi:methylated-DNA-[protein]-cysteine S-methyltransferase